MKRPTRIVLLLFAGGLLFTVGRCSASAPPESMDARTAADAAATRWTCPMHPQIVLPDPGDCPICSMDLVPMAAAGDEPARGLSLSPAAVELSRIVTQPVRREAATRSVRMVGKVDFDETAVRTISAWVPGRLERLFVDYTGVRVQAGDHLVRLYSPDLLSAQEELLGARERLSATAGEASEFLSDSNRRAYEGARQKLVLWGLTEEQVDAIEARGSAEDHVMLTSPASGVVIDKALEQGAYVETGTPIYTIADLARLWIRLDAYEQDLPWLRPGQEVVIEAEALPGRPLDGSISFIDPVVDEGTRTAKVRVNVDNTDGRLKPGMFVRAVVAARIGAQGTVLGRHLAGKWVSPMHPEIVKDAPGSCDVCGMDLVRAEDLGLVDEQTGSAELPLVVPASAVLVTGRRAVVYVEVPDAERPTYEGREIRLGPRAGDDYLVWSGLEENERVVVQGAFRIDSAMQIRARPSMMSQPGESVGLVGPAAGLMRASLRPLLAAYLAAQEALASDDEPAARNALARLGQALDGPGGDGLPESHRTAWRKERAALEAALAVARSSKEIEGLRAAFHDLSKGVLSLERRFGHDQDATLREVYCPMALDGGGAAWLQLEGGVRNPYMGAAMLRCGEPREAFPARGGGPSSDDGHGHGHDDEHAAGQSGQKGE